MNFVFLSDIAQLHGFLRRAVPEGHRRRRAGKISAFDDNSLVLFTF
jgi:hypothetical protein